MKLFIIWIISYHLPLIILLVSDFLYKINIDPIYPLRKYKKIIRLWWKIGYHGLYQIDWSWKHFKCEI